MQTISKYNEKIESGVPQHECVDSVMNRDHDVHSLQSILETLEQTAYYIYIGIKNNFKNKKKQ